MKKQTAVKILSFSLAALLASIVFLCITIKENRRFRLEIENSYSRSLEELGAGINNISLTLRKAQYVSTPKQVGSMAAKLLTEAELAKNALSQLPHSGELTSINKFLSQVGNYAMSVSKNLISTGQVTQTERENITLLYDTAEKVAKIVSDSQIVYNNPDYWAKELENEIDMAVDEENLSSALGSIEDEFTDYPTLIYDGPYSDHILEKEPEMLKNAETVSENEAKKTAAKFSECGTENLTIDGMVFGNMPAYRFAAEGLNVTVSKAGGYCIYMRKERVVSDILLSYEQAVEKAKRYLSRMGLSSLKESYYFSAEGICIVNFAYIDGETICYTDLIKVGVAMDNGEIMFYEASGYISNHKERTYATPKYTADEAKELISDSLTLQKTAIALIPTDSGEERCYEFSCVTSEGQEILIYINTLTLDEQEVLILLKDDGGTLVK